MRLDSDVALIGTGLAPLMAASHLMAQGKRVTLLNPDHDYFLEDSELPLDPLLPADPATSLDAARLKRSLPESALAALRPHYPGALVYHGGPGEKGDGALGDGPEVRARTRLIVVPDGATDGWNWDGIEEQYLKTSDAGLKPQLVEGFQAVKRFPGYSARREEYRGIMIPKLCDLDVVRYRHGLLEFLRERLGAQEMVSGVSDLDPMPGGLRFYAAGAPSTIRLAQGALLFWTPRMSAWIQRLAKRFERKIDPSRMPSAVRAWEQWTLLSRDPVDPSVVGTLGESVVWADLGAGQPYALNVLMPQSRPDWVSSHAMETLSELCGPFLGWDRFSVRMLRPRIIHEWAREPSAWDLLDDPIRLTIVSGSDGAVFDIAERVTRALGGLSGPA